MTDKLTEQEAANRQSREVTEGVARTPNRAMLRAVGFRDEDFRKPIVGLASAGFEVSPCNVHRSPTPQALCPSMRGWFPQPAGGRSPTRRLPAAQTVQELELRF